jgi:hypothetical protein
MSKRVIQRFLVPKDFKLFGFQILFSILIISVPDEGVIPETRCWHYIWYLVFISNSLLSSLLKLIKTIILEPWLCQTKDYWNGIYCFPAKHLLLRGKSKHGLYGSEAG